jgi:hypothetical protein
MMCCHLGTDLGISEGMIGRYHTRPKLRVSDQKINELFRRFVAS